MPKTASHPAGSAGSLPTYRIEHEEGETFVRASTAMLATRAFLATTHGEEIRIRQEAGGKHHGYFQPHQDQKPVGTRLWVERVQTP